MIFERKAYISKPIFIYNQLFPDFVNASPKSRFAC